MIARYSLGTILHVALAVLVAVSAAQAKTVYVSPSGDDANSGLSWAAAKRTVQAGVNAASSGDQVWVAAGTYVELVSLTADVSVYGGFVGDESLLAERDFRANRTVLDGNRAGSVVLATGGTTPGKRIDGFTIRNGNTGVFCSSAMVTIANNLIVDNSGAGISCYLQSPVIVNNCIVGNGGLSGGGISIRSCSPTITNNTIVANGAVNGGAIYCENASPAIVNTLIAFNSSGLYRTGSGTVVLRNNCVFGNSGYDYAGLPDPTGVDGNISADPRLGNPAYGETHIEPDSPCRDAGDDAVVEAGWLDIDAESRIEGDRVDIGADESHGTVWPTGPSVVVRVNSGGDDANDGSSWLLAKRTVQAGIDAAAVAGGEVWVQAGTYLECLTLPNFVHLYGGFAGTEESKEGRDWRMRPTVLDGNQAAPVIRPAPGGFGTSTIDGFTIQNGRGGRGEGAGIHCKYASPMIANNTIRANSSIGIRCDYACPRIVNNLVTEHTSSALVCSFSSSFLANNAIIQNSCARGSASIACTGGSLTAINNTLAGNGTTASSGAIDTDTTEALIVNNIIALNSSGIRLLSGGPVTLRSNCIYGNLGGNYHGLPDATGADGNISVDPKLANRIYGDTHIQPDSPCKDAGDGSAAGPDWRDRDGTPRVAGGTVDIGADESDGTVWPTGPSVIVRVSPEGDDANDGSSWVSAKRTIQAGIAAASAAGGDVWVRAGTYPERLTLKAFAHVYGGFSGVETERSQRDWTTQESIVDGEQAGSVVTALACGLDANTIDGFTLRNGKAPSGGGIRSTESAPLIANNVISENTADYGGGIHAGAGAPTIVGNRIVGNSAARGAGVYADDSTLVRVGNNRIEGNTALGEGGGLYGCVQGTIVNNTFTGNSASKGGGVHTGTGSNAVALINNTIVGNTARAGGDGGAMFLQSAALSVFNNVIALNSSGVFRSSGTPELRHNCVYGNMRYNYSGVTDPTGTGGNIAADPRFVRNAGSGPDGTWGTTDDDYGDLHLQVTSPCIDAGENAAVLPGTVVDLTGRDRFVDIAGMLDTGSGTPPIVDIGAYEHHPATAADLNNDGQVDLDDLNVFLACCSGPAMPYNPQELPAVDGCSLWPLADDRIVADFDGDGDVDQEDFGTIQRCYSGAGPVEPGCMD